MPRSERWSAMSWARLDRRPSAAERDPAIRQADRRLSGSAFTPIGGTSTPVQPIAKPSRAALSATIDARYISTGPETRDYPPDMSRPESGVVVTFTGAAAALLGLAWDVSVHTANPAR